MVMPNSNINIDIHLQNNMKETRTSVENGINSFTQYREVTNGKATNCSNYRVFQEGTTRFVCILARYCFVIALRPRIVIILLNYHIVLIRTNHHQTC